MSVWIAGATVTVGAGNMIMADKASKRASKSNDKAIASTERLEREKLDFAYEQYDEQLARYDEWRQIYGPLEENLGDFYNLLTPETYTAAGLEYNQAEFQKAKDQTFTTLQQRGLGESGLNAAIEAGMNIGNAEQRAKIRRDAPFKVAEEKGQFLSQGKGGPTMPPTGTVGDVLASSNLPGMYQNEANRQASVAGDLWNSAGNLLSTGLQYGATNYQPTPTANQGVTVPTSSPVDIGFSPTAQQFKL